MASLSELRAKKNITQEQMGKMLGVGTSTYNQYENSQRNIPMNVAEKISEILGVKIEDVFLPVRFTVSKKEDKQNKNK